MQIVLLFLLSISFSVFAQLDTIKMQNAKSIYIIDGDSISLSMRISGIDTPEKLQKCNKNPQQKINCGTIAKEYLRILLDNIDGELLIKPVTIGYYNRILVDVYKGGINIGKMMVSEGMAFAFGKKYKLQEQEAKLKKKGFWGYHTMPIQPKIWRKRYGRKF